MSNLLPAAAPRTGVWLFPAARATELVDAVIALDQAGIDEVWIADEGVMREPLVVLSAAAVRTTHIKLCVGITTPVLRHPGALGATMATLDELSDGRAVLGLGLGGTLTLDPFGLTADRPVARLRDAIRIARGVTSRTSVEGYDVPDHAMPARRVPIYIASRGEQINRLASREADGVFLSGLDLGLIDRTIEWSRSVHPIEIALYPSARFRAGGPHDAAPVADPTALAGTPAEVAARLAQLVAVHTPSTIGLGLVDGAPVAHMVEQAIETFRCLAAARTG